MGDLPEHAPSRSRARALSRSYNTGPPPARWIGTGGQGDDAEEQTDAEGQIGFDVGPWIEYTGGEFCGFSVRQIAAGRRMAATYEPGSPADARADSREVGR